MLERLKNYFRYGILATDEHLGIENPMKKRMAEMEANEEKRKGQPPVKLEAEDRKAILIASIQVLGPLVLGLLAFAFLVLYLTAKFF